MCITNIKLLYKTREVVIKLFNDYSSIASEAKYKATHGKNFQVRKLCSLPVSYLTVCISKY